MSRKRVFGSLKEQALTAALGAVLIAIGTGSFTEAQAGQRQSCSSSIAVEQGQTYSYFQAKKASEGGHIVLHYGAGIRRLGADVAALTELDYPVTAIAGGPQGAVRVFMNGKRLKKTYDQSEIDNGRLGGLVASGYDYATKEKRLFNRPVCGAHVAGR